MNEILTKALNPVILVFMVSALLECGLSLTLRQIVEPLRNIRLVISAAAVSYVLVPLIAVIVSWLFRLGADIVNQDGAAQANSISVTPV